jgi:hypothetical protein
VVISLYLLFANWPFFISVMNEWMNTYIHTCVHIHIHPYIYTYIQNQLSMVLECYKLIWNLCSVP